jgi:uncharacterized membrane-anchored protein YjiN (DUF445 family)
MNEDEVQKDFEEYIENEAAKTVVTASTAIAIEISESLAKYKDEEPDVQIKTLVGALSTAISMFIAKNIKTPMWKEAGGEILRSINESTNKSLDASLESMEKGDLSEKLKVIVQHPILKSAFESLKSSLSPEELPEQEEQEE